MKYYIIPDINNLEKSLDYSNKYNLGFEYNDFFNPKLLDDKSNLDLIIKKYQRLNRKCDTLHGVFYDICLNSCDSLIKEASEARVISSFEIAKKLNVKGVVFHTNYITWMNTLSYKKSWIEGMKSFFIKMNKMYPDIEIYIENMFDNSPDCLKDLMDEINNEKIRVCLDVAHASISNIDLEIWFKKLSKDISHIHINDNDLKSDLHEEIGLGKIDFDKVYKLIKEYANNASILIEISDLDKAINSYLKVKKYDNE